MSETEGNREVTYRTGCMFCGKFVDYKRMSRGTVRDLKDEYRDAVCPDCLRKEREEVPVRRSK